MKKVEEMEEKEREIYVGESRFYLGEDNIIYATIVGKMDAKIAIEMNNATLKLMNLVDGKVNVLTDDTRAGKPTSEAMKIYGKFVINEKYGKLAIFGLHPVARVIASFWMETVKKNNMRFFKTREESLAWLKER